MRDHIGTDQVAVSVDTKVGVFHFLWTLLVETISPTAGIAFLFSFVFFTFFEVALVAAIQPLVMQR